MEIQNQRGSRELPFVAGFKAHRDQCSC